MPDTTAKIYTRDQLHAALHAVCLLYTSDAADE